MDEALIENAKHDVDRDDRRCDQELLGAERPLIFERGARKSPGQIGWQMTLLRRACEDSGCVAQRFSCRKIERNGCRHELALMVDRERRIAGLVVRESQKRRHGLRRRRYGGGA